MTRNRILCVLLALSCLMASGCGSRNAAPEEAVPAAQEEAAGALSGAEEAALPEDDAGDAVPEEEAAQMEELAQTDGQESPPVDLGPLLDEGVPLADSPASGLPASTSAPGTATKASSAAVIDYSNANDGYVMASWKEGGSSRVKVLVKGPSGTTYQYNLNTGGSYEAFPLSDGNGSYTVGVYKNVSGTQYSTVVTCSVSASMANAFAPFIRPNQYVNYTAGSAAVKKAADLCAGKSDALDKVSAVYSFVVKNTKYDKEKAASVQSGYLPNVDNTLSTGKGICFDYAALMAAMLRSQSVPTKLVVGYTGSAYHAWLSVWSEKTGWIEGKVYFDGNQWKLMDPTFASSGNQSESIMQYIGNGSNYQAKYQY